MTAGSTPKGDRDRAFDLASAAWGAHRNASGLLYGALVTGAVIGVSAEATDSAATIVFNAVQVLIVYWAAHVYIRVLADRLADPTLGFAERVGEALRHELAVLLGGAPALAVFVVASVAGVSTSAATNLALAATILLLGSAGYVVGRQAQERGWALVGEVVASSLLGLLVVGLKAMLH